MRNKVKWLGDKICNFCREDVAKQEYFVDGRVSCTSSWALMCEKCFSVYGEGIGVGIGQVYNSKTFEKIEG